MNDILAKWTRLDLLTKLNSVQQQVVQDTEGAFEVSAGPGSGKTRVLTHRIAHLVIDKCVYPSKILAVTFTNKAVQEIKDRFLCIPPHPQWSSDPSCQQETSQKLPFVRWIYTFHSLCMRILRQDADCIGFDKNFSIYDELAKQRILKAIVKEKGYKDDLVDKIERYISDAKNNSIGVDSFIDKYTGIKELDKIADVYREYQAYLKKANAFDFDDLLFQCEYLLRTVGDVAEYWQNKFEYILVDEFQDTNTIQYNIIKILASKHKNIFIVGDSDQSIYGWRGANDDNRKSFNKDFSPKLYKLEQNYRSTKTILDISNKIIKNNPNRVSKELFTDGEVGDSIIYKECYDEKKEAEYVVEQILYLNKTLNMSYSDIAVLMRINAITIHFERALLAYNIPYRVYGGFKFFDRKEIKDLSAYLKLINNHNDMDSFLRIANYPKRGIGDATLLQLQNYLKVSNQSIWTVLVNIEMNIELPSKLIKKLLPLAYDLKKIQRVIDADIERTGVDIRPDDLLIKIIDILKLKDLYKDSEDNLNKWANIEQLVNLVVKLSEEKSTNNTVLSLSDFLANITLDSQAEFDDEDTNKNSITLSTVHNAKGLEWDSVFVVGLEEGIFPSNRARDDERQMQEERRLVYVACTRAKKYLYMTCANNRVVYGKSVYNMPSRFLVEAGLVVRRGNTSNDEKERVLKDYRSSNINSNLTKYKQASDPQSNIAKPTIGVDNVVYNKNADVDSYKVGQTVNHKKFGSGVILSIDGDISNKYALVEFKVVGQMTLSLAYAPLTIEQS